ncbi:hypothetical protein JCM16303_007113 [Sporobolomyces ruberrimus]
MEQSQWATIHSLPPEILFYIVRLCITVNFNHFAYGANVASWDSNESIWKMQLVCKAWREPALRASLHSVSIFDLKSARSFLRTLAIDPIRSVCVKYLALGADDSIQGSSHEADSVRIFKESIEMTQVVLAASPALVHLHVHPLHFAARNHLLAAIRSSRHLQTLVISPRFRSWQGEVSREPSSPASPRIPPKLRITVVPTSSSCPSLRSSNVELDFASTWSAPVPAIVPEAQPNSIKILWLNCDCEESALWQVLMKSESLEVLQLYFERLLPKEGTVLALMHSTDTMKRLHYTCNPTEEDLVNFDPTETPILDLVLPRYRRLESLSVTATELSCHLFRLLPRSLKTLEITSLNDRAKFFLDLQLLNDLEDDSLEITLEELTVRDEAQIYDPDTIQQFYERCVKRGIVFTFQPDSPPPEND